MNIFKMHIRVRVCILFIRLRVYETSIVLQTVKEITCNNGHSDGVLLGDGRHITGKVVMSNATPHITFDKLVQSENKPDDSESSEYFKHIAKFDYTSPVTKINGKFVNTILES